MPLSLVGLGAGSTLAFARGLGEFGATIMFAGGKPAGVTRLRRSRSTTLDRDFEVALALGALLVVVQCLHPPCRQAPRLVDTLTVQPRPRSPLLPPRADVQARARDARARRIAVGRWEVERCAQLRACCGPSEERIALGAERWLDTAQGIDVPPERRSVGLVFQEYALFPHLTVRGNVAFGGRGRVDELLERFRIAHLGHARPGDLSGGERQRVALARALAREGPPSCFSTSRCRRSTPARAASSRSCGLLSDLRLPTVLVTHDFEDAAALADRVGVMVQGRILQLGGAAELLAAPTDAFVAGFTGANLLPGTARAGADGLTEVVLDAGGAASTTDAGRGRVALAVYPWEVSLAQQARPTRP